MKLVEEITVVDMGIHSGWAKIALGLDGRFVTPYTHDGQRSKMEVHEIEINHDGLRTLRGRVWLSNAQRWSTKVYTAVGATRTGLEEYPKGIYKLTVDVMRVMARSRDWTTAGLNDVTRQFNKEGT